MSYFSYILLKARMALFQKTIIKKYTQNLNQQKVQDAYVQFQGYFLNATIQKNIREAKEEQFQEGFLRELFGNVLGYTLNPKPNFNLTTELKNISNSKKADGAIIIDNKAVAVIELKGTETTDLTKIETQAFGYKNNQTHCTYVITSNFEKVRFYIDNAIEYIEFNLFNLTREEFNLLWLCLSFESIKQNIPKRIKDESVSQEDIVTKKLYNDYSVFKRELYQNLVQLNPQYEAIELFKLSQKLLDRFLFIFFAEDRLLLPTNLIYRINKEWQQLREMRIEVSLYDRYKIYFHDLNVGAKVSLPAFSQTASDKKEEFQIYAYNGGLFKDDEILNSVKIDDDLLFKYTETLSKYDFQSEIDVNILGHIFENSLNELDEIKAQLDGTAIDKTKTKRKKDGVFYTPKYITKYIVENTVGKLCSEKKESLNLIEEEYTNDKKKTPKVKKDLLEKLNTYRNWLLQITICDPACGSGAFLNQALDFLITEHRYIDELQAKLFGDALVLSDVEGSILENNLFGVDINEESVEIAKLSLWLRTAQPNRKLSELSNNIKCGNSLIDDPAVAGDKAFNWQKEFPQVFGEYIEEEKIATKVKSKNKIAIETEEEDIEATHNEGHFVEKQQITNDVDRITNVGEPMVAYEKRNTKGFDVVIGNPPYTYRNAITELEKIYFKNHYKSTEGNFDLYKFFIERIQFILKQNGYCSYIVPNTFLSATTYKKLREIIIENYQVIEYFDLGLDVFENVTVENVIFNFKKLKTDKQNPIIKIDREREGKFFSVEKLYVVDLLKYFKKDKTFNIYLSSDYDRIIARCQTMSIELSSIAYCTVGVNTGYIKNDLTALSQIDLRYHKMLNGKNIGRNFVLWDGEWIMYDTDFVKSKGDKGRSLPPEYIFTNDKILVQRTRRGMKRKLVCYYDNEKYYNLNRLSNIVLTNNDYNLKYIYLILNSELLDFYFNKYYNEYEVKPLHLSKLPIKPIKLSNQSPFIAKADLILTLNKELQEVSQKFQRTVKRKFNLEELPKKLQDWYLLSYAEFIKELAKKKIKLTLAEEAEWEQYFQSEAKKALELKAKIDVTDKEIDLMVYKLYELTYGEVKIVEPETVLTKEQYEQFIL